MYKCGILRELVWGIVELFVYWLWLKLGRVLGSIDLRIFYLGSNVS